MANRYPTYRPIRKPSDLVTQLMHAWQLAKTPPTKYSPEWPFYVWLFGRYEQKSRDALGRFLMLRKCGLDFIDEVAVGHDLLAARILAHRYIEGHHWPYVCDALNMSERECRKRTKAALAWLDDSAGWDSETDGS